MMIKSHKSRRQILLTRTAAFFRRCPLAIALLYAMFYFPVFYWLEHRQVTVFYVIRCGLDKLIPFVPAFVVPYVLWFLLIPGALLFFSRFERERYYELCWMLFMGMTICLLVYLVFPNRIYLRMDITSDDIFSRLVGLIRSADTPTNVCPSIHVASTAAVMLTVARSEVLRRRRWVRHCVLWTVNLLGVSIWLSTMFLKQHSAVDVAYGLLLTAGLYLVMLGWLRLRAREDNLALPHYHKAVTKNASI